MSSEEARARIGQLIKAERLKRGWTQAELARRTGTYRSHIALIESATLSIGATVYMRLLGVLDLPSAANVGLMYPHTHVLDQHRDAVIAALTGGESARRVGRVYGVSAKTTAEWARRNGFVARPGRHSGWKRKAEDADNDARADAENEQHVT